MKVITKHSVKKDGTLHPPETELEFKEGKELTRLLKSGAVTEKLVVEKGKDEAKTKGDEKKK